MGCALEESEWMEDSAALESLQITIEIGGVCNPLMDWRAIEMASSSAVYTVELIDTSKLY